ncbi:alpha/beta fold hydrolase [bacterium]|nr:alpha/beta fold hydrolase [bacterium]
MRHCLRVKIVLGLLVHVASAAGQTGSPSAAATEPPRIEDCVFTASVDGTEQKYVLVYPSGVDESKPMTLLVALHGHGSDRWQFVRQSRGECKGTRDVAVQHSLLLVSPDYRATTSWMGPKAEADLLQILKLLKERFRIRQTIVAGGSMGGTGALTFTARHPDLVDGVVALNGTANLVTYERFGDAISASFGGSRDAVPDEYRQRSAEFFPDRFTMPIAATTGGADTVVPPDSVLRLLDTIRPTNSNVLSIHRPQGGHSTSYEDTIAALEFVVTRLKSARASGDNSVR